MSLISKKTGKSSYTNSLQTIFRRYHMPPLDRVSLRKDNEYAKQILEQARVLKRALAVSVPFASIEDPQTYQHSLRQNIQSELPNFDHAQEHHFSGTAISELNHFLENLAKEQKHIVHLSANTSITLDQPLVLREDVFINGHDAHFISNTEITPACIVVNQHRTGLSNVTVETRGLGILIQKANHVVLHNIQMSHCRRGIAILEDAHFIEMSELFIEHPDAGILVQGDISHLWLHHSSVLNGKRADNGGAGILFTDARTRDEIEAHSWGEALTEALWPIEVPAPHAALVEYSSFSGHVAQGVYIDGGYGIVIQNNVIADNDKEGICLDFGAVNNVILENSFIHNGCRARQSDESLKADLIFHYGKLADNSAVSKLPAISIDNAAQNIILWNIIREGAGDGVKIVRTGIRNFIIFNIISDNNKGESNQLHFSGVLLGSAKLEEGIDPNQHPLDFLPAVENIVAGNIIYGSHFMGILVDRDATFNDIYDNMVRHYRRLPFARANKRHNGLIGNSWQARRRGKAMLAVMTVLGVAFGFYLARFLYS